MKTYTVGILVHGDNHLILRGPEPDREAALALVRHWSIVGIGAVTPPELVQWSISTREFREELDWAVAVTGGCQIHPEVARLLDELSARGIVIQRISFGLEYPTIPSPIYADMGR